MTVARLFRSLLAEGAATGRGGGWARSGLVLVRLGLGFAIVGTPGLTGGWAAEAASPLSANVTGGLRWLELPDAPPLGTEVDARVEPNGKVTLTIRAKSDGLAVVIEAELPGEGQPGSWKIAQAEIDLAIWSRIVATRFAAQGVPSDLKATGTVRLSGGGAWREGAFSGAISERVENAELSSESKRLSASGVTLTTDLDLDHNLPRLKLATLTAKAVQVAGVVASNLSAEASTTDDGAWSVRQVQIDALGGRLTLQPFLFRLGEPVLDLNAVLSNLALADLATFVPQALASAQGRVNGQISVHWSPQENFTFGQGNLRVAPEEKATLRLTNSPGLLSQRVPAKINVLPGWLGPLAKSTAADSPAYVALKEIEEGKAELRVDQLEIALYPDGKEAPLSARLNVTATPPEGSQVKTVHFSINVIGPLEELLKIGMDNRVNLSVGARK